MTTALRVDLAGNVDAAVLGRLREDLELRANGRLSDVEDVEFGYRTLDPANTAAGRIDLSLRRHADDDWAIVVRHDGAALPGDLVEVYSRRLHLVAQRAGLEVVGEFREPPA